MASSQIPARFPEQFFDSLLSARDKVILQGPVTKDWVMFWKDKSCLTISFELRCEAYTSLLMKSHWFTEETCVQ